MPIGPAPACSSRSPIGKRAAGFHNNWLLALCVIISLFVLVLLL